jgi:hypothetical protein
MAWRNLSLQVISNPNGAIKDAPLFPGDEGDFALAPRFAQFSIAHEMREPLADFLLGQQVIEHGERACV